MNDSEVIEDRRRHLRAVVQSDARLKVIVAGPGTGKTFTCGVLLRSRTDERLVLTFVRSLVGELRDKLGDVARVMTFHAFAKWQIQQHGADGLSAGFDYYPLLAEILAEDGSMLMARPIDDGDVKRVLHEMLADDEILIRALECGNYYNAVGYSDSVYRIVRHFNAHPNDVPRFEQIVVDEFQDFNLLEVSLIRQLAERSSTLIVGDDDQALYEFKQSSPDFLRELVVSGDYERFELPYCSRCTHVLVAAAQRIVDKAQAGGRLQGRVPKQFECFMPDKRPDSDRYPRIVHAQCTVDRNDRPYISWYVERAIAAIPPEDIAESWREGYPTVLVTGPGHFAKPVHDYLEVVGVPNLRPWGSGGQDVRLLDGYARLADEERSRLGWRIVMFCDPPAERDQLLRSALEGGEELADLLPAEYKEPHLRVAGIVRKLKREEEVTDDEVGVLWGYVALDPGGVRAALNLIDDETPRSAEEEGEEDREQPSIAVTTLESAKGLQAAHVFIVGVNAGHFPKRNDRPTDHEVCCMIVALTRATKCCHVVTCGRPFGSKRYVSQGVFVDWLGDLLEPTRVDADYFRG